MAHSNDTTIWNARMIGRDPALVRSIGGATFAFGLGPALGEIDRIDRLTAVAGAFPGGVGKIAFCRQIHSDAVHRVETLSEPATEIGDGDALITTAHDLAVLVWTADCVPILLAGDGAVAAVHSGWRGCAADVIRATVQEMQRVAGVAPTALHAALGPAVCGSCYAVGAEVPEALRRFDLDEARWLDGNHVDLRGFLAGRLEALGVPAEQIETVGGCTVESPVLASYRRDGEAAGRQWSIAVLNS
jgi:hypothetical protein